MNSRADVAMFLQGLTGLQPLIILMLLSVRGAAQTMDEMRVLTCKSADALQPALNSLEVKGLVVKQVGEHGRCSYMPGGLAFFSFLGEPLSLLAQNPALPDSGDLRTVVGDVAIGEKLSLLLQQQQQQAFQNPALPDSGNKRKDRKKDEIVWHVIGGKSDEEISACFLALRDLGIIGSKAEKLSHLDWTTPEYIRAVVEFTVGENTFDNPVGMAIRRMEDNFSVDMDSGRKPGHPVGCKCGCRKVIRKRTPGSRKYTENSFSALFGDPETDLGDLES